MTYRFTREAGDDLVQAAEFYQAQRHGLGAEFLVEVGMAISRVLDAPMRWPIYVDDVRKYRLDRFPYGIFYREAGHRQIVVIACSICVETFRRLQNDLSSRRGPPFR